MNPGAVELQEIQVDKVTQNNRCECWTHNIADQFPIRSIKEQSGDTIIEVGPPHEGYSIETTIINGKMNGISKILSPDKNKYSGMFFFISFYVIMNSIYQYFWVLPIVLITIILYYSLFLGSNT